MKMAKPSEKDIDAAGDLMALLDQADRGDYPGDQDGAPDFFDADDHDHLRAFYDAVMATMQKSPGYPCRVIGGMCYVIMWDKNEIVDPASDVIELHPKLVKALAAVEPVSDDKRDAALFREVVRRIGYRETGSIDGPVWSIDLPRPTRHGNTDENFIAAVAAAATPPQPKPTKESK